MELITISAIANALATGLVQIGRLLLQKGVTDPALEQATHQLKGLMQRYPHHTAQADESLLSVVRESLTAIHAPIDNVEKFDQFTRAVGLIRLTAIYTPALRRHMVRSILAQHNAALPPPSDLVIALGWPRSQLNDLKRFLTVIRTGLSRLESWQAIITYANDAAKLDMLDFVLGRLARMDNLFVETGAAETMRLVMPSRQFSIAQVVELETTYRRQLVAQFADHDLGEIAQMGQHITLPLIHIYLEPSLLTSENEARRLDDAQHFGEASALPTHGYVSQDRVTDALARSRRLVILGEPGAGKTITLRFMALMLAYSYGATRLGLDTPYLPILIRLADFAQALAANEKLSLNAYLLRHIEQQFDIPRLGDFFRLGLEQGACMILLDGLDEIGTDAMPGRNLHQQVIKRVQQFAYRWCSDPVGRSNRLVITSRIESYWSEPLRNIDHVQLSPLQAPTEVEEFLRRWYTAYEQMKAPHLTLEQALHQAESQLADLLSRILAASSMRQLASNPLLLTLLTLVHEVVGKLPNRRALIYDISAQTLIDGWRNTNPALPPDIMEDLGQNTLIRIMAPLAYRLHEAGSGNLASFENWQKSLVYILTDEGFEPDEAVLISNCLLDYAHAEVGLIVERSPGQFGFFHTIFEDYLAARQIARQSQHKQQVMLQEHWEDPRWHEVILLAAGQLGIIEARQDDASQFIENLLSLEATEPTNTGRQVVLAGRALGDIGLRSVTRRTRRRVLTTLQHTMQDVDPDTVQPRPVSQIPLRTRYDAGEVLDGLGWLPPDLNTWVCCSQCADDNGDLWVQKYLVTNAQFAKFIAADGYRDPVYWGGIHSDGWQWRQQREWLAPRYWQTARFGRGRRGYPVVTISWYEAKAYASWVNTLLQADTLPDEHLALIAGLREQNITQVRLPTETEWVRYAGGATRQYPWDKADPPRNEATIPIQQRANVAASNLEGPSPVAMYPLGASYPFGLMDLAGNVAEWTATSAEPFYVLRGGAWYYEASQATIKTRLTDIPYYRYNNNGLRLVAQ